jgi:hypothetical protein
MIVASTCVQGSLIIGACQIRYPMGTLMRRYDLQSLILPLHQRVNLKV